MLTDGKHAEKLKPLVVCRQKTTVLNAITFQLVQID